MGQTDKYTKDAPTEVDASDSAAPNVIEQTPDTPGKDENGDGLTGGQATADTPGDVLGI